MFSMPRHPAARMSPPGQVGRDARGSLPSLGGSAPPFGPRAHTVGRFLFSSSFDVTPQAVWAARGQRSGPSLFNQEHEAPCVASPASISLPPCQSIS